MLTLFSIIGCDSQEKDTGCEDIDQDGFCVEEDCDDGDAAINPNTVWYQDADQDGYGNLELSEVSCQQSDGYVSDNTDCDDGDALVYPGADEYCNKVDDDCDGEMDEGDAVDALTWYEDADGDGFGDPLTLLRACYQPSEYVTDNMDCDDGDRLVYPGADEYCNKIDDNCDGEVDEGEALDATVWYADIDSDGFGDPLNLLMACYQPSEYVTDNMDCDDTDEAVNPDMEEICNDWVDNDCDGTDNDCGLSGDIGLSDADAKLIGESVDDRAGQVVSGVNDVNGDGYDDILVGAEYADSHGANSGTAYLVLGPVTGNFRLSSAHAKFTGESSNDYAGRAVSRANDMNSDGFDDILVGAYGDDTGGSNAGAVYLMLGPAIGEISLSLAHAKFIGEAASNQLSYNGVSDARDVNADGYQDIVIGAYGEGSGGSYAGAAYLVLGPVTGEMSLSSAHAKFIGESTSDYLGSAVSEANDVNADGYDDLLIGAPYASNGGAAYLVLGPVTGEMSISLADAKFTGEPLSGHAGKSLAGVHDVNADGYDDILVGTSASTAYIVLGPVTGEMSLSSAHATFTGESNTDAVGNSVSGANDMNVDGYHDILIGAYLHDSDGVDAAGATYLVLSPVTGEMSLSSAQAKFTGEAEDDYAGCAVSGANDVDGDGYEDILIGAYQEDSGGTDAGAAYLVLGGGL